jgi:hypothetical protein
MCLKVTLPTLDERSAHLWEQFSVSSCATVVWRHPSRAREVFKNLTELCEVLVQDAELFGLECRDRMSQKSVPTMDAIRRSWLRQLDNVRTLLRGSGSQDVTRPGEGIIVS